MKLIIFYSHKDLEHKFCEDRVDADDMRSFQNEFFAGKKRMSLKFKSGNTACINSDYVTAILITGEESK